MKDYTLCPRCGQEGHMSYACKVPVPTKPRGPDVWKESDDNPDIEVNQHGEKRTKAKPFGIFLT